MSTSTGTAGILGRTGFTTMLVRETIDAQSFVSDELVSFVDVVTGKGFTSEEGMSFGAGNALGVGGFLWR